MPLATSAAAKPTNADTKVIGVDHAACFLGALGMTVAERRWRPRPGSLDLIAVDGTTVVAVTVITRYGGTFTCLNSVITSAHLQQMSAMSDQWLATHHEGVPDDFDIRFDGIAVYLDRDNPGSLAATSFQHLRAITK